MVFVEHQLACLSKALQRLVLKDQAGIFVPLCTRNVFLKCYSPYVAHAMFWSEEDRDGYQAVLSESLVQFFTGTAGGAA